MVQKTAAADNSETASSLTIDSLVKAGKYYLQKNDFDRARVYFSYAYHKGMSKDSMMYFAAEIYLLKHALDTALVFNHGLELNARFNKKVILEQRSRIYASMGLNRQADSLMSIKQRKIRSYISLYAQCSRNLFAMKPFLFSPLDFIVTPDNDIDDIARIGFTYKLIGEKSTKCEPLFLLFDFSSGVPVPTPYSFDEQSDTLIRTLTLYCGVPGLPKLFNGIIGYRMAIHSDGKVDHFDKEQLFLSLSKRWYLTATHESKWVDSKGIIKSVETVDLARYIKKTRYQFHGEIGVSHRFYRSFQNKGIKIGYIDSIDINSNHNQEYHYYRDSTKTISFDSPFLDEYWSKQPLLQVLSIPEHDISLSVKSNLQIPVKKWFQIKITGEIYGTWYPLPVTWYTYDLTLNQLRSYYDVFSDDFIVYHSGNGQYYLHTDPTSHNHIPSNLTGIQFTFHKKKRLECFVSLVFLIEKNLKYIGNIYAGVTGLKNFSTLAETDPLSTFNYGWEFKAGWKKDISLIKK